MMNLTDDHFQAVQNLDRYKKTTKKLSRQFSIEEEEATSFLLAEIYPLLLKQPEAPLTKTISKAYRSAQKSIMKEKGAIRTANGYEWHHTPMESGYLNNISNLEEEEDNLLVSADVHTKQAINHAHNTYRKDTAQFVQDVLLQGEKAYKKEHNLDDKAFNQKIRRFEKLASTKSTLIPRRTAKEEYLISALLDLNEAIEEEDFPLIFQILEEADDVANFLEEVIDQKGLLEDLKKGVHNREMYKVIQQAIKLEEELEASLQQGKPLFTASEMAVRQAQNKKRKDTYNSYLNGSADDLETTHNDDCQLLADPNLFHVFGSSTVLIVDRNGREVKRYDSIIYQNLMKEVGL
ncbi:hypothetical protein B5G91_12595 [Listeria monocytogenes]|nr:hypothetical protein [Listeria monocytogenes]